MDYRKAITGDSGNTPSCRGEKLIGMGNLADVHRRRLLNFFVAAPIAALAGEATVTVPFVASHTLPTRSSIGVLSVRVKNFFAVTRLDDSRFACIGWAAQGSGAARPGGRSAIFGSVRVFPYAGSSYHSGLPDRFYGANVPPDSLPCP
jgi:hypothetical protein